MIPYAGYLILKQAGQYFDEPNNWKQYCYCAALLPAAFLLAPIAGIYLAWRAIKTPPTPERGVLAVWPGFFQLPKWTQNTAGSAVVDSIVEVPNRIA